MKKHIKLSLIVSLITSQALITCAFPSSLELRGKVMTFPFWLGTTMYNNMWKGFSQNEFRTDWWWFDKNYWSNHFSDMEKQHLNALLFCHPHP